MIVISLVLFIPPHLLSLPLSSSARASVIYATFACNLPPYSPNDLINRCCCSVPRRVIVPSDLYWKWIGWWAAGSMSHCRCICIGHARALPTKSFLIHLLARNAHSTLQPISSIFMRFTTRCDSKCAHGKRKAISMYQLRTCAPFFIRILNDFTRETSFARNYLAVHYAKTISRLSHTPLVSFRWSCIREKEQNQEQRYMGLQRPDLAQIRMWSELWYRMELTIGIDDLNSFGCSEYGHSNFKSRPSFYASSSSTIFFYLQLFRLSMFIV